MKQHHIRNLSASMKPYWGEMLLTILCAFVKQASIIGAVSLTSYIVGLAMAGTLENRLPGLVSGLILCIILRAGMNFAEMYFGHDVAFRTIRDYRLKLYHKLSELAPAYMLRQSTGKLGQTLVGDVEVLELFLAHTFGSFIVAVVMTVAILIVLFGISPLLAAVLLPAAILVALIPYRMKKRAAAQGKDVREQLADNNATMVEGVQGLREIISFNHQARYIQRCQESMNRLYAAQQAYGRRKGTESMLTTLTVGCFTVSIMLIAAHLVTIGRLDFSLYPVAVMLSSVLLTPVMDVATVAQELGLVFAAATRIQGVLNEQSAVPDIGTERTVPQACEVEFRNVSFSYDGSADVLKNVSFSIAPGERVVLVGHSGAGKSTCANLLLRYWDADEGHILINHRDIRSYALDCLRETVSAVQQESYLFHDTLRENIRLGQPGASDEEVAAAAKAANAEAFILKLPEKYDTIAGERGYALSGGQRQRVSIARTILKDTPVVIFDEAVSSLDTENEREIQNTLRTQLKGKTVLMIAHRLSTILSADRIILLDHGTVAVTGTHEQLLRSSPAYRQLIQQQL